MNRIGISGVGIYRPRFGLEDSLAQQLGAAAGLRLAAPDEDAVTMAWECLRRLPRDSAPTHLYVAAADDGLEPRAMTAHLHAMGALPSATPTVALHDQTDISDALDLASRAETESLLLLVDHERAGDPLEAPNGDLAVAVLMGKPDVAAIAAHVSIPALTFDRWHEADERADRDAKYVEDRLAAREGREVIDRLRKDVGPAAEGFLGAVVTAPVRLKGPRLAQLWEVPKVWLPANAATEPGQHRAGALLQALLALAEAGPGSSIALVNLGWGASGILLSAGPQISQVTQNDTDIQDVYSFRSWLRAHRPPYTANPWTSGSELSREAGALLGLVGSTCSSCSMTTFPAVKVCEHCGSFDLREVPLERTGTTITHSIDELYGAPDTSVQMVVVALDNGAQFYGQAVQGTRPWFGIDERCELVIRRLHTGSGLPHYYWKVDRHGE